MRNYWRNVSFSCGTVLVVYALLQLGGIIPADILRSDVTVLLLLACGAAGCLLYSILAAIPFPTGGALTLAGAAGCILGYLTLQAQLNFQGPAAFFSCLLMTVCGTAAAGAAGRLTAAIEAAKINARLAELREARNRENHGQNHRS